MDELEFRRRIFADPNSKDKDIIEFTKERVERQRLSDDLKAFDAKISSALDVPVPENLAQRIILNQTMEDVKIHQKQRKANRFYAVAASLVIALSAVLLSAIQDPLQLGEHALQHVYHEIESLDSEQSFSLNEVNIKLAEFGGFIEELPGQITYVTYCDFKGQKGLHMVIKSDFGPITVFIVPAKENEPLEIGNEHFSDERFAGHISRSEQADTILVANLTTPIESYQQKIDNALRWL